MVISQLDMIGPRMKYRILLKENCTLTVIVMLCYLFNSFRKVFNRIISFAAYKMAIYSTSMVERETLF